MHVRTKERVFPAENASDLHEDLPPKKKKLVGRSEKFGQALTINNQFCFTWPNIGQAELAISRNMDRSRMSGIGKLHDDVHVPCDN